MQTRFSVPKEEVDRAANAVAEGNERLKTLLGAIRSTTREAAERYQAVQSHRLSEITDPLTLRSARGK